MLYRRTHTRELDALSEMNLSQALPFAAFTFVIASAASMGIPGFSGFVAEITILIGAWQTIPSRLDHWRRHGFGSGFHLARAHKVFLW
jgi:NADH-quinone oxidoreductase subunit M